MQGKAERHSRHLYDIFKIMEKVQITDELAALISEVRKQRSTLAVCPSAKENVCVTDILYEIIEKETYKKDYEEITLGLLFVPETYDTVIQSIKKIADSGLVVFKNAGHFSYLDYHDDFLIIVDNFLK